MAGDVVIRNPAVERLNTGITMLLIRAPFSKPAAMVYDRWSRFVYSPLYAALPDVSLYPVLKAFAAAYAVVARIEGVPADDVDPSLLVLAAGDAKSSLDRVGHALDQTLDAAARGAGQVTKIAFGPVMLGIGVLVALALARGHIRLGK